MTKESDTLNGILGVLRAFENGKFPMHHLWGVPIFPLKFRRHEEQPDTVFDSLDGFASGLLWKLERPGKRRQGFPSWSWTGWKEKVKEQSVKTINCMLDCTINISTKLNGKKLMHWAEYDQLGKKEKGSFIPLTVLQITVLTFKLRLRVVCSNQWKVLRKIDGKYKGWGKYGGEFILTRQEDDDTEFRARLESEEWLGIVIGFRFFGVYSHYWVMVLDESNDPAERIGLCSFSDKKPLFEWTERRTIRLG